METSFRALVAEVVGKYPQYQQILVDVRAEHSSVKTTLKSASAEIDRLNGLSAEYMKTLTGIRTTTEQARDAALRYAKEASESADGAKYFRDDAKAHKEAAYKLFLQIEAAIAQINQIAKDYAQIELGDIIRDILNNDANFELALSKIVSLLVLEPQYVSLRDSILENSRIILKDIKLQGKLATDLYTDTRDMLASEKIDAFVFLKECDKRLADCNKLLADAIALVDSNRAVLLDSLRNEWLNGVQRIETERTHALFQIETLKNKATGEILAKESSINALFAKTQSIIRDSEELAELCKNYAFVHRVREFSAVKRLLDAASYANYIQSQSQKAILTYTQFEARICRNEAEHFAKLAAKTKREAEQNIARLARESAERLETIAQSTIKETQEIAEQNIAHVNEIKDEAIAQTTELARNTIAQTQEIAAQNVQDVRAIKDEAIAQTQELKGQTEQMLDAAQTKIADDVAHVEDLRNWCEEKTNMMFILSHLKGAREC